MQLLEEGAVSAARNAALLTEQPEYALGRLLQQLYAGRVVGEGDVLKTDALVLVL